VRCIRSGQLRYRRYRWNEVSWISVIRIVKRRSEELLDWAA
jgi:hypothetical protein